jgi:hypothetical protein
MNGYKTIPSKQRYMTLAEIRETYGVRGVVAYSCRIKNGTLEGGFVVAVQDAGIDDSSGIKEYQRLLRKKYPDKAPIFYLRMEDSKNGQHKILIYDNGSGEKKAIPTIEIKKSAAEEAVLSVPSELLAQALKTSINK